MKSLSLFTEMIYLAMAMVMMVVVTMAMVMMVMMMAMVMMVVVSLIGAAQGKLCCSSGKSSGT